MHIDEYIKNIDEAICENLDNPENTSRGRLSRAILSLLRHFVEHIFMKLKDPDADLISDYMPIKEGIAYIESHPQFRWLRHFHDCLQESVSHYVPNKDESERLMLKYYEYLLKIKRLLNDSFNLQVLRNIERFPVNQDKSLVEYYEKIAEKIDSLNTLPRKFSGYCYRVIKNKPFFVNGNIYYEVTFSSIQDRNSKFDRVIAFTKHEILDNYTIKMIVNESSIEILNKEMPVKIITDWRVSIRPCEFKNLKRVFDPFAGNYGKNAAYEMWMDFLTKYRMTLLDVLELPDDRYSSLKEKIWNDTGKQHKWVSDILDLCRPFVLNQLDGSNIIRYLLYTMDNDVIKDQFNRERSCFKLSNLYLKWGCIPFDKEPFYFSLIGHNARFYDLLYSVGAKNREHEMLARCIKNNIERQGKLFTPIEDLASFENIGDLITRHYEKLWKGVDGKSGHIKQMIYNDGKYATIRAYQEDTAFILNFLYDMSNDGMLGYKEVCDSWLANQSTEIVGDDKRIVLPNLFSQSKVSLIYGPAGTGKTTIIKFISQIFENKQKLFLAQTNPAVQNLQRRVSKSESTFSTITKYLNEGVSPDYDIIVVDECSTVSNADMRKILEKGNFSYLVLVGDVFQIESIDFGNWFSLAPKFMPKKCRHELLVPYRAKNKDLISIWDRVRELKSPNDILEYLTHFHCTTNLDESIFKPIQENEIILCLNYDGLYGINNINHFMQCNNTEHSEWWGVHLFKENDPILFKENERFKGLLYNNLKGRIKKIEKEKDRIWFTISVDTIITELDAQGYSLELLSVENGKSVIRFDIDKYESDDEEETSTYKTIIPFQIAYAVSIHKAQGLEYDSVKIVVSSEVDEQVSHNIFYTAITRARQTLKIYWTPETEKNVLEKMKKKDIERDAGLLKNRMGWKK